MELSLTKLTQVSTGANSRIYMYGEPTSAVGLKVVAAEAAKESRHLENEYSILKQVEHDNIIMALKLKRNVVVNLGEGEQVCNVMVMEWAAGGSLLDVVRQKRRALPELRELFCQTAEAVEYLHCNYFVHRDNKLENVLLSCVGN